MPDTSEDLTYSHSGNGHTNGKSTWSRVQHVLGDAGHRVGDLAHSAKGVVTKRATSLASLVKAHPRTTTAIGLVMAAAAGYLVFRKLRRS